MHFDGFAFIVSVHFSHLVVRSTAVCMSTALRVIKVKSSAYAFLEVETVGIDLNLYPSLLIGRRKSRSSWKTQSNKMVESTHPWKSPITHKKKTVDQLFVDIIAQSFS